MRGLLVAAAVAAVVVSASARPVDAAADEAAACAKSAVSWRFAGKERCLPRARVARRFTRAKTHGHEAALLDVALDDRWLRPYLRVTPAQRLQQIHPRAERTVLEVMRIADARLAAQQQKKARVLSSGSDGISVSKSVGDGITVTLTGDGSTAPKGETGGTSKLGMKISDADGNSLGWSADETSRARVDTCPSPSGEVSGLVHKRFVFENFIEIEGTRHSLPIVLDTSARLDGQVGDDARLQYFDVDLTDRMSMKGYQQSTEFTSRVRARVDPVAAAGGTAGSYTAWQATTDVTVDAPDLLPGWSPAEARRLAEAGLAARASAFDRVVQQAAALFREAEKNWYEGNCTDTSERPRAYTKAVKPGERVPVEFTLKTKGGARVGGIWTVRVVDNGIVAPMRTKNGPSTPAEFVFTARSAKRTDYGFSGFVTSPAGRSSFGWGAARPNSVPFFNVTVELNQTLTLPPGGCGPITMAEATLTGRVDRRDPTNVNLSKGAGTYRSKLGGFSDCEHPIPITNGAGRAEFTGQWTTDGKQLAVGFIPSQPPIPRLTGLQFVARRNGSTTFSDTTRLSGGATLTSSVKITVSNLRSG